MTSFVNTMYHLYNEINNLVQNSGKLRRSILMNCQDLFYQMLIENGDYEKIVVHIFAII